MRRGMSHQSNQNGGGEERSLRPGIGKGVYNVVRSFQGELSIEKIEIPSRWIVFQ